MQDFNYIYFFLISYRVVDPEENLDDPFGLFGGKLHAGCENNGVLEIWKYLNFLYNLKSERLKVKIVKKHKKCMKSYW